VLSQRLAVPSIERISVPTRPHYCITTQPLQSSLQTYAIFLPDPLFCHLLSGPLSVSSTRVFLLQWRMHVSNSHKHRASLSPWFDHPNNIWPSWHFLRLMSECPCEHFDLKHPQSSVCIRNLSAVFLDTWIYTACNSKIKLFVPVPTLVFWRSDT
jgi:hypothetical protein